MTTTRTQISFYIDDYYVELLQKNKVNRRELFQNAIEAEFGKDERRMIRVMEMRKEAALLLKEAQRIENELNKTREQMKVITKQFTPEQREWIKTIPSKINRRVTLKMLVDNFNIKHKTAYPREQLHKIALILKKKD